MLDWDVNNYSIVTTSLHSFEGDAGISASLPASPYGPRLLSDPQVPLQRTNKLAIWQKKSKLLHSSCTMIQQKRIAPP